MTRRACASGTLLLLVAVVVTVLRAAGVSESGGSSALPSRLSDTGLYAHGTVVDGRNRPFAPQYPLWSDGAAKTRWVYLPAGTTVDVTRVDAWEFPVGTRFWKEFRFDGRKVETRLLSKASDGRWMAGTYVWNGEQTEATLAPAEGVRGIVEIAPARRHSIPSRADCAACHGEQQAPLGFNVLQLSTDRDANAIHGEPLAAGMVTLATLVQEGRLSPTRTEWLTAPPRVATASARTRSVLGYLAANCGSCHTGQADISVPGPSMQLKDLLADADRVAAALLERSSKWQVPGTPDGSSLLLDPASPERSALLVRMHSRRPSSQMPPLGTVVRDDLAVAAVREWIERDLAPAAGIQARGPGRD